MSQIITFPASLYSERIHRAQTMIVEHNLSAVIVATGADFFYFTGSQLSSHERLSALIIPAEGSAVIVAPVTDIFELDSSPVAGMDITVHGWKDGDDIYSFVAKAVGNNGGSVAVSADLTADHLLEFQKVLHTQWVLANDVLAGLFMVKDSREIAELERAAHAIDRVHAQVPALLQPGRTEREVAQELEALILQEHVVVDFIIVGSKANGANPHHSFSDRVLEAGDPCVVDIGGTLDSGYHSDCTRTYVVGGDISLAPPEFREAYEVLYDSQKAAREFAAPGITAANIDASARTVLDEAGWGSLFTHRLGHGIGLSGHERPSLMAGNNTVMQEGMAFSIEPGLYKAGEWGMRLEDIVVVTRDGIKSLNEAPRELL